MRTIRFSGSGSRGKNQRPLKAFPQYATAQAAFPATALTIAAWPPERRHRAAPQV